MTKQQISREAGTDNVLQQGVDGHVHVGVAPGGHGVEGQHVVILSPGAVLINLGKG